MITSFDLAVEGFPMPVGHGPTSDHAASAQREEQHVSTLEPQHDFDVIAISQLDETGLACAHHEPRCCVVTAARSQRHERAT